MVAKFYRWRAAAGREAFVRELEASLPRGWKQAYVNETADGHKMKDSDMSYAIDHMVLGLEYGPANSNPYALRIRHIGLKKHGGLLDIGFEETLDRREGHIFHAQEPNPRWMKLLRAKGLQWLDMKTEITTPAPPENFEGLYDVNDEIFIEGLRTILERLPDGYRFDPDTGILLRDDPTLDPYPYLGALYSSEEGQGG